MVRPSSRMRGGPKTSTPTRVGPCATRTTDTPCTCQHVHTAARRAHGACTRVDVQEQPCSCPCHPIMPPHPILPHPMPCHAMPSRHRAWAAAWQMASFGASGVHGLAMANSGKNKMLRAHGLCALPSPSPSPEEQDPARARLFGTSTLPSPTRSLHPKPVTGAARTSTTSTTSAPQWPPPVLKTMRRWRRGPPRSPGGLPLTAHDSRLSARCLLLTAHSALLTTRYRLVTQALRTTALAAPTRPPPPGGCR